MSVTRILARERQNSKCMRCLIAKAEVTRGYDLLAAFTRF